MTLTRAEIQLYPKTARFVAPRDVRSAVSLHSHSAWSRETLAFVPGMARCIPLIAALFERSMAKYERVHGRPFDFSAAYWRPPLTAAAVIASERQQIERRFDISALVSLTDHDTLEGARTLRASGRLDVPLSVEWTVPFERTVFHLGVHGVSPESRRSRAGDGVVHHRRDGQPGGGWVR